MGNANAISEIRENGIHVWATVKGREASKHALRFGVKIASSRFWFTQDNWKAFNEVMGAA